MQVVLDQENPDLFKWVTGQEEPPPAMAANPAFAVSALSLFCRPVTLWRLTH